MLYRLLGVYVMFTIDESDRQSDWDERNCEDEWWRDPDDDD